MSSNDTVKCKKCHCIISEESVDRLCDNCNMDLIAQNLAAEMSQHEIHCEDQSPHSVEIIEYEDPRVSDPEMQQKNNFKDSDISLSIGQTSQSEDSEPTDTFPTDCKDVGEMEIDNQVISCKTDAQHQTSVKEVEKSTVIIIYDETSEDVECDSVAPEITTPTRRIERRSSTVNERKRKLEEPSDVTPEKKLNIEEEIDDNKDEESSSDESDIKNIKVEPMRTRAKVSQEEAAAQKQHEVCEDEKPGENEEGDDEENGPVTRLTRKALAEIEKYKHPTYEPLQTKSRRTKTFKSKPVYKAPTSQASIYSSDYVFYKGRYYQSGDVVVLRDIKRPGDFYAQITSFLTDQYCHKCATIQWLFPTKQSPPSGFDPRTYILGYLDETPRPLSALQPVMHLPSDYYRFNKTPYPPPAPDPLKKHYLWKRAEPVDLEALLQGQD